MPGIDLTGSVKATDLRVDLDDVRYVEQMAARAWPAAENTDLDGWIIRYSPGVSNRRANSVLPIGGVPTRDITRALETVEAFYRDRSLPSRFMISPAAQPQVLDDVLRDRGYHVDAPTLVQWGLVEDVVRLCPAQRRVSLLSEPGATWMQTYMEGTTDLAELEIKSNLIRRIGAPHVLAEISIDGFDHPVAVGLCVLEGEWAGIFCMHTLTSARRNGYARDILAGLATWAHGRGAVKTYLQVECENPAAQRFYKSSGFTTEYGYHYRTKETPRVC